MSSFRLNDKRTACYGLALAWFATSSVVCAADYPLSAPLEDTVVVFDQLTSGESEDVPPEPIPPSEYLPLDSQSPALVAEEILRLRDALGTSPLNGRRGFRPLTLANESDEDEAVTAPWEREDDRQDFRERLRGMASRPMAPQPMGVPYGSSPYPVVPTYDTAVSPFAPQPAHVPYGYVPTTVPYATPYAPPMPVPAMMPTVDMEAQKQIDVLRQTAHQLDQTAHQLECSEQFDRADQVRALAEAIRLDARRARQASESTAMRMVHPATVINPFTRGTVRVRIESQPEPTVEVQRLDSTVTDAEPNCPACPSLRPASQPEAAAVESETLPQLKREPIAKPQAARPTARVKPVR